MSYRNGAQDVNRGPGRWERAINAFKKAPDTQHGKLYQGRFEFADKFDHGDVNLRRWIKREWSTETWSYSKESTDFYTCSAFCAALQSHLSCVRITDNEFHFKNAFVKDEYTPSNSINKVFEAVRPQDLTRQVRCHVCRRVVKKDGTTDSSNRVGFWDIRPVVVTGPAVAIEKVQTFEQVPVVGEIKKTLYVLADGSLLAARPLVDELQLTTLEVALLESIPKERRRSVLQTAGLL